MPETTTPVSAAAEPLTTARDILTSILEQLASDTAPDGYRWGSYGRQEAKQEALRQLPAVRAAVDGAVVALVGELRGTIFGSWDQIGDALGVSKQAARERFRRQGIQ